MTTSPDPDRRDAAEGVRAEQEAARVAAEEQRNRAAERLAGAGIATDEQHRVQNALLAGLALSAKDLSQVAQDLYRASVLSRTERFVLLAILLIQLTVVAVVGFGVLRLNTLAETNRVNGATVIDCTQPGGDCYERAQKQTAGAVAQLSLVTVVAVECADSHSGPAVHTCIEQRIQAGR